MITISNGAMMRNTISFSRINQIVNEGHDAVAADPEYGGSIDAEGNIFRYAPKMGLGEKMYDYVFCGNVKREFMKSLYKMSRTRAWHKRNYDRASDKSNEDWNLRRDEYFGNEIRESERQIQRMLSGKALKFGTDPTSNAAYRDTYLIYRDNVRHLAIGLPLNAKVPSPRNATDTNPLPSAPAFDTVAQIRVEDLEAIKKSGQVRLGNSIFDVRFQKKAGPVVMHSTAVRQRVVLQRRLLNLWAVIQVQKRLADSRLLHLESTELAFEFKDLRGLREVHSTNQEYLEYADWKCFTGVMQEKFTSVVEKTLAKFKVERGMLESELERFLTLTKPGRDDQRAFLKLQEKIALLERLRDKANQNIKYIKLRIEAICSGFNNVDDYNIRAMLGNFVCSNSNPEFIKDRQSRDLFKLRLLNLFEQMNQLFLSEMSNTESEKFKNICNVQLELFARFLPDQLKKLIEPPELARWNYRNIHPPVFQAQRERLFDMLKNPAVTWSQIEAAMSSLQIEQSTLIKLKTDQIEMGYRLERSINETVRDDQLNGLIISQGDFSPEYRSRIDLLEQIRGDLLSPGNNFTQPELDALANSINHSLSLAEEEYRSRGFMIREMPQRLPNAPVIAPVILVAPNGRNTTQLPNPV